MTDPTPLASFINEFLFKFVASILITVVLVKITPWLLTKIRVIKSKFSPADWNMLMSLASTAVNLAEQTGLTSTIKIAGKEKFKIAETFMDTALEHTAFQGMNPFIMKGLIESGVKQLGGSLSSELLTAQPVPQIPVLSR